MQPEIAQSSEEQPGTGARIGAGFLNIVYVPGRALICGAGSIAAGAMMLVTLGSAYREATSFFKEGCLGRWTVSPAEVANAPKSVQFEY